MTRFAFATACLAILVPSLRAADASKPAGDLVRQLGDDSFEVREAAIKRLAELGRSAEAALRNGLNDDDPEVRRQCQLLLNQALRSELMVALDAFLQDHEEKHVLKLPTWKRFRQLGDDTSAKALFVEMCCNETTLLEAVEKDPRDAAAKFLARAQQLQQSLFNRGGTRGTVTLGQVTALLFIATDPRIHLDVQAHYPLYTLLHQPGPREGFQNNPIARKLLVNYIENRTEPNLQQQNLFLAMNFNLKESVGWALKIAKDAKAQPYVRGTALGLVGRMGGKELLPDLEPLLADTTKLGQAQFNTVRINTEVRDVALAMVVFLSGQPVADYGFAYFQVQPALKDNPQNAFFSPTLLGFSDDKGREAAFKRWKEWSEAEKKKK